MNNVLFPAFVILKNDKRHTYSFFLLLLRVILYYVIYVIKDIGLKLVLHLLINDITAQFKCNLKWYFISMWSQNIVFKKLWMLFKYQNTFRILLLSIVYSFASHILFITSKGIMEMTNDKYKQRKTIKWSINNSTVSCCILQNLWRCWRT